MDFGILVFVFCIWVFSFAFFFMGDYGLDREMGELCS
jgi:hypothetical protein